MDIEDLRDFLTRPRGAGVPLCGKCGGMHDPRYTECPPKYCPCCGTTHKPNKSFHYNNCQANERFRKWHKGHTKWVKENTRQIWAQRDTGEEDD